MLDRAENGITLAVLLAAGGLAIFFATPAAGQDGDTAAALGASLTSDGFVVVSSDAAASHMADVDLALDLERLTGWRGARVFLRGLWTSGPGPGAMVGGVHGVSSIEAPESVWLHQAWLDQTLAGGALSVRGGLYDINAEFDVIDAAEVFLNPSHGIGPDFSQTGRNGPSTFPWTSLAVRIRAQLGAGLLQATVLDAVPGRPSGLPGTAVHLSSEEGALVVGEWSRSWASASARVALGGFVYTTPLATLSASDTIRGSGGAYLLGETSLGPGLPKIFARLGLADGRVNDLAGYVGGGAVLEGAGPGDVGFAVAVAFGSDAFEELHRGHGHDPEMAEMALELTYRLQPAEWITVQPDVQYVRNPNLHAGESDGFLVGVRASVGFQAPRLTRP